METLKPFEKLRGCLPPVANTSVAHMSIDPGLNAGWALWTDSHELAACGIGSPPFFDWDFMTVTIEKPQVYPRMKVPPNDLIALAITVGRMSALAEARFADVQLVTPHEWKGSTPKDIHNARVLNALSSKELETVKIADREVPKGQRNNMIDAIGIGLFAYRGMKL